MQANQSHQLNPVIWKKLLQSDKPDSLIKTVLHNGEKFNKDLKTVLAVVATQAEEIRGKLRAAVNSQYGHLTH